MDIDEELAKQGIYRVGNSFSDTPIKVPAEIEVPDNAAQDVQQDIGPTVAYVEPAWDEEKAARAAALIEQWVKDLKVVVPVTIQPLTASTDQPPGFAGGGHIRGPGTSTSDSILARLSDGEYVVRAAAVRKYGLETLNRLNGMSLPRFATGGLIEKVAEIEPRTAPALGTLNFNLPGGEQFSVNTAGDWSDDLRRAALKYGKPR